MGYQFPQDIEERIHAQLRRGEFANEEEVIREAIGALERRQRGLHEIREMVQEADEDIDAGRVGTFDADATKQAVRERLERDGVTD